MTTLGKVERWNLALKSHILLTNYFLPGNLGAQIKAFVEHYKPHRYHESLKNVTSADVYFGRAEAIIKQQERINRKIIEHRCLQHSRLSVYYQLINRGQVSTSLNCKLCQMI